MLSRSTVIARVGALVGCLTTLWSGCNSPDDVMDDWTAFMGGALTPPGCPYVVTTTPGTTAPELADGDVIGPDPVPRHIHLGLSGDPATSMVVGWTADEDTNAATVRFGLDDTDDERVALTWQYRETDGTRRRAFEAHLCGLRPDTQYVYRIDSDDAHSDIRTFRTAPDPEQPDASAVILVLGDARGRPDIFGQLVRAADTRATPDLILFTGDAVTDGGIRASWDRFFQEGEALLGRVPMLATVGNHEDGAPAFFSLLALPGDERFFGLDFGPVHICVADDTPTLFPDPEGIGAAFLDADLASVPADRWRLVMHHQPIYSASDDSSSYGGTLRLRERWMPLYDRYRVHLVLNGHDHKYERTFAMRGEQRVEDEAGTWYIVSGGAGAPLRPADVASSTAVTASVYHYTLVTATRAALTLTTYDDAGNVLDTAIRRKLSRPPLSLPRRD